MIPKPLPTVTVTATATATVTTTPPPAPPDAPSLPDQLQGWGTLVATLVAVAGFIVALRTAKRDREEGEQQRWQDRKDADRRLAEERQVADTRLQRQLGEQRERERRSFIVDQLQKAAVCWSDGQINQLPGILAAIPDQNATLLRYLVRGEDYYNNAGFSSLSDATLQALEQRLRSYGLENQGGENYLAAQLNALREKNERAGKGSEYSRLHPSAVALYRVGYDYKKIQPAWVFEEIGDNIADLLNPMEATDG